MNYYFLIASLPMLHLGARPHLRMEHFRRACEEHLPADALAVLRDLLAADGRGSAHPFARAWLDRETEIRNTAARLRAQKKGLTPDPWIRPQPGFRAFVRAAVSDAFQEDNPLDRERALDRLRWTLLDELAGLNPFSLETVFAYGLRLRLAERWAGFDEKAGAALLETTAANAAAPDTQTAPAG